MDIHVRRMAMDVQLIYFTRPEMSPAMRSGGSPMALSLTSVAFRSAKVSLQFAAFAEQKATLS